MHINTQLDSCTGIIKAGERYSILQMLTYQRRSQINLNIIAFSDTNKTHMAILHIHNIHNYITIIKEHSCFMETSVDIETMQSEEMSVNNN